MKYLILLLKLGVLIALINLRLGEWDISWVIKSKYRESFTYYVDALSGLAIFLLILDFIQFFTVWWYRRRHKIRGEDNFVIGVGHIYSILLFIGVVAGILSLFRINAKELFTSLSIIFAGIAILSKDYISNMINGMILTFSGQMSIGDNVRIGEQRGKITDITLLNIHLQNDDDDIIYIPNNVVFNVEVINYTKREVKRTSIDFDIDLKFLKTIEDLEANLVEALKPFHDLIREDSYYLRVFEVHKDRISLKFQYILKEPNKELERQIRRRTVRRLIEIISAREKIADKIPLLPDDSAAEGHNYI
jgi:small-conductance mechanosensitive channel